MQTHKSKFIQKWQYWVNNGRGMPVDIHPDHQPGVELSFKLHAGANFEKIMDFQEGCMAGVSVVNALSAELNVIIKKDAKE